MAASPRRVGLDEGHLAGGARVRGSRTGQGGFRWRGVVAGAMIGRALPGARAARAVTVGESRKNMESVNRPGSLGEDLASQRDFVRSRSPAYGRLLELLEAELNRGLEARLAEAWRGRRFGAFYERPLLLLSALREGEGHPLWRGIAGPESDPSGFDAAAVAAALAPERAHLWSTLAGRHLQTNEPSRAVAWLWPAGLPPA